jgi:hypothetical protein
VVVNVVVTAKVKSTTDRQELHDAILPLILGASLQENHLMHFLERLRGIFSSADANASTQALFNRTLNRSESTVATQDSNGSWGLFAGSEPNASQESVNSEHSNTRDASMSITESDNLDPRTLHERGRHAQRAQGTTLGDNHSPLLRRGPERTPQIVHPMNRPQSVHGVIEDIRVRRCRCNLEDYECA